MKKNVSFLYPCGVNKIFYSIHLDVGFGPICGKEGAKKGMKGFVGWLFCLR